MGEERLLQRVMFGELVGGKGYSGGQEKDWLVHLKEDMSVFGMKFEGWRKATQKAGRWFRRVEEGAELFMWKWHKAERRRAAKRHAKAAEAPSTVGISTSIFSFVFFFRVFLSSRVTGACPVTTDLIMRVNVKTTNNNTVIQNPHYYSVIIAHSLGLTGHVESSFTHNNSFCRAIYVVVFKGETAP